MYWSILFQCTCTCIYPFQTHSAGFAEYKKQHVMTAVHSRSGKRLTAQEVDSYHISEDRKETEVTQVRLENIKLQNKIAKQESLLKQKV